MNLILHKNTSESVCKRCGNVRKYIARGGMCHICWTALMLRRYRANVSQMSGKRIDSKPGSV